MLCPAWRRPQRRRLRGVLGAAMATAAPVVRIVPLQVERAFHQAREDLVIAQVRRKASQPV
jgi:hypothetical protein